jgi:hypothetical protein
MNDLRYVVYEIEYGKTINSMISAYAKYSYNQEEDGKPNETQTELTSVSAAQARLRQ